MPVNENFTMKKLILILTSLMFTTTFLFGQGVTDDVISAFQEGDANQLSGYFNSNVELIHDGPGKIYNKNHAGMIMQDFFSKNEPTDFTKIHEGNKESSIFLIGNLTTSSKKFRISILMKKSGSTFLIHQIRIQNV